MPLSGAQKATLSSQIGALSASIGMLVPDTLPSPPSGGQTAPPGTFKQYALPASSGTTFGQNLYGFAFRSNGSSKQADICQHPVTGRMYTQGGDTLHSATDGTWGFDPDLTNIRLEFGVPIYPTLPAPHALQDDYGFEWDALTNRFFMWPGGYFAYEPDGSPIENYCGGCWWFDPAAGIYLQDNRLFPNTMINGQPSHTAPGIGCPNGGFFDHQVRQFGIMTDSTSQPGCQMYDVATMVKQKFLPLTIQRSADYPNDKSNSFVRTKYAMLGRDVYFVGKTTTDGVTWHPGFWSYNVDARVVTTRATPRDAQGNPVLLVSDLDTQLAISNGKIVWPKFDGPDGVVKNILLYTPATNSWAEDTQKRPDGFMGNVTFSMKDGSVALGGGVFGPQQTHFNYYWAGQ